MKTPSVLGVTPFWPDVVHSEHHSHFNPFAVNNLRIAGYSQRLPTADREPLHRRPAERVKPSRFLTPWRRFSGGTQAALSPVPAAGVFRAGPGLPPSPGRLAPKAPRSERESFTKLFIGPGENCFDILLGLPSESQRNHCYLVAWTFLAFAARRPILAMVPRSSDSLATLKPWP